ncbi:MAG: hypothetical protein LUD47_03810 [Clostridia bacterium]|nr:hypothetical protein [Clostridia bacterium]
MMRKKLIVLGAVALITACSVSLAACSSSATSASLYSTWYNRIDYGGIQPKINGQIEEAEYDIGFEEGSNAGYEISVATENKETGEPYKMHTKFYTLNYDWSDPLSTISDDMDEKYAGLSDLLPGLPDKINLSEFPDDYGPESSDDDNEIVYAFSMYYTVPVTYTSDDYEGNTYDNTHFSICYFRTVNKSMMPVFSYEYALSTTPSNPNVLTDLLIYTFSYENTVYYNYDCTECTCVYNEVPVDDEIYTQRNKGEETRTTTVDLTESENEFFDNASIYVVMRALNYYSASSFSADVFIPLENKFSTYTISGGVESVLSPNVDGQKQMLDAMAEAGYFGEEYNSTAENDDEIVDEDTQENTDGENRENTDAEETTLTYPAIYYSDVTLTLSADLTGPSQEVWFAAATGDSDFKSKNYTRATMLYMSIPFAYTLGTTTFTLSAIYSSFNEYGEDV